MSSFNYFTPNRPYKKLSSRFAASECCSASSASYSSPSVKSSLNPSASSYIPDWASNTSSPSSLSSLSLNVAVQSYIPASLKPHTPNKHTSDAKHSHVSSPSPSSSSTTTTKHHQQKPSSFALYMSMSPQMFNCTQHCLDARSQISSSSSSASSSTCFSQTPMPASVCWSDADDSDIELAIDVENIKPYIPDHQVDRAKPDIDLVSHLSVLTPSSAWYTPNVITEGKHSECADLSHRDRDAEHEDAMSDSEDVHPVFAGWSEQHTQALLNAPVWSPEDGMSVADQEEEEEEEEKSAYVSAMAVEEPMITYSKVALAEDDYQYLMHPNKAPVKFSHLDMHGAASASKVAVDPTVACPAHIQYMQPYQYNGRYVAQQPGESYDAYLQQLVIASHIDDAQSETNQHTQTQTAEIDQCDRSSVSSSTSSTSSLKTAHSSSIAPEASAAAATACSYIATEATGYCTMISDNHLIPERPSKIAMAAEGLCHNETNETQQHSTRQSNCRVAMDNFSHTTHAHGQYDASTPYYGESRVAQPPPSRVQYIYCRT
mmetsp:Transcript_34637/g.56441  ORF Transcript_34637/g.56441 Transcript_34637/m.56441 type:complete len:545 (+) Transcript_34637:100-1734(+)